MEEFNEEVIGILRKKLDELKIDPSKNAKNVYAAIIIKNKKTMRYELISLGTGNKCLSDGAISDHADGVIHDMHAEVICRRSFMSFIYAQLLNLKQQKYISNDHLLFDEKLNKHYWNPDLDLLFYTSQSPCKKNYIYH